MFSQIQVSKNGPIRQSGLLKPCEAHVLDAEIVNFKLNLIKY